MLKKTTKRFISIVMAAMMIISMIPFTAFAADETTASDLSGHWAENVITEWMDYGIINGYEDGTIRPNNKITRAEMTAMLDRVMDYQTKADNTFSDLGDSWYTDVILKANAAGVISGYPDGTVKPDATITRQEAVAMFSRVLSLDTKNAPEATFTDNADVADWAKDAVNAMAAADYIHGSDGQFRPNDGITRAEVVTILNNIFDKLYQKAGEYTGDVDGSAVINTDQVTLKDMTISGDLIIAEGVGDGHVVLDNVTVDGKLIVRGGGENSVIIKGDSKIDNISVERIDGAVRIAVEDNASVNTVLIDNGGQDVKLEGTIDTVNVASANVNVDITGAAKDINVADTAKNATITVTSTATADNVSTSAENTTIIVAGAVSNIDIADTANNSVVTTQSNATVDKVTTAAGNTTVEGTGTVTDVVVGENASDATVTTEGTKVENNSSSNVTTGDDSVIAPGTTDTTPGGTTETPSVPSTPSTPSVTYYTVTYVTTDGTTISTQSVASGSTATAPTADVEGMPSVEPGNKLTWYNDSEPFDFTTPITGNITLTAVVGSDDFAGGNGTEKYPYLISNAEQFNAINNLANDMKAEKAYSFKQTSDFTLNKNVQIINGIYDGGNYTITAPETTSPSFTYLFRNAYGNTTFKNLNIKSTSNCGLSLFSNYDPAYESLIISNIHSSAVDNAIVEINTNNFGFLIINYIGDDYSASRDIQQLTTIENCTNTASLVNLGTCASAFIGSGYCLSSEHNTNHEKLIVRNCSNSGNITSSTYAGLICGNPAYLSSVEPLINDTTPASTFIEVTSVSNTGTISASSDAGVFGKSTGKLAEAYPNDSIGGNYEKIKNLTGNYTVYFSDNNFSVKSDSEDANTYKIYLSVSTLYDHEANLFGNSIRFPFDASITTNENENLLDTTKIHAYDLNSAIENNIVTAETELSYQTYNGYEVALFEKEGVLYLILKNSEGKVDYVDSNVSTLLYAFNGETYVGYKQISQSQSN